ncbi:hypothetical protein ACFOKI_12575 [Sphingomonas qilianensis]|uniref:Glycosyltransferase n=1 Tax=Sphingomonas qilianensis TaxID=1736690 RepID=A0ABU9XNM6_9SPHN
MTTTLIQIVPQRSIAPEGVGDYARLLAEQLWQHHGRRTIFVAGSPLQPEQRLIDEWETHELIKRSASALLGQLASLGGDTPILLHLSAYGYHRKGVPLWLATALEHWRQANPETPLVTVFHELYVTGPPWRRAFWWGKLQARIARRIQRISTGATTTTAPYAAMLGHWSRDRTVAVAPLPVFSTIGESDTLIPATARPRTLILFGRDGMAQALYRDRRAQIAAIVAENDIAEIIDVGQRSAPPPAMIGRTKVRPLGQLPSGPLQAALSQALFGLIAYDADRLAKSTLFAAYCANGVIPVCLDDAPGMNDGLRPGKNYLKLGIAETPASLPGPMLDALQRHAHAWYQPHNAQRSADLVSGLLGASVAGEQYRPC